MQLDDAVGAGEQPVRAARSSSGSVAAEPDDDDGRRRRRGARRRAERGSSGRRRWRVAGRRPSPSRGRSAPSRAHHGVELEAVDRRRRSVFVTLIVARPGSAGRRRPGGRATSYVAVRRRLVAVDRARARWRSQGGRWRRRPSGRRARRGRGHGVDARSARCAAASLRAGRAAAGDRRRARRRRRVDGGTAMARASARAAPAAAWPIRIDWTGRVPARLPRHRILVDDRRPRADGSRRRPGLLRAIAARLPDLRLLTDPADRESYRRDETAYLAAGLPLAVALPVETARGRRARPAVRRARRPDRAARRRVRACRAARPGSRAR